MQRRANNAASQDACEKAVGHERKLCLITVYGETEDTAMQGEIRNCSFALASD